MAEMYMARIALDLSVFDHHDTRFLSGQRANSKARNKRYKSQCRHEREQRDLESVGAEITWDGMVRRGIMYRRMPGQDGGSRLCIRLSKRQAECEDIMYTGGERSIQGGLLTSAWRR